MLDLDEKQLAQVRAILADFLPDARVWAFGSRTTGKAKRFSDLDLAVEHETPLTLAQLAALREAFEVSDLPMQVEIVDAAASPPPWLAAALKDGVLIHGAASQG